MTPAQARRIDDVRRLHMLSAMAQSVAETISSNTVSALAAARKRGIPLGASRDGSYRFTAANKSQRGQASSQLQRDAAKARTHDIAPVIEVLKAEGRISIAALAEGLTLRGVLTAPGRPTWSTPSVHSLLQLI